MKYIKKYEKLEWDGNILGQQLGKLAEVSDDYYAMELNDVDFLEEGVCVLKVHFYEKNNPSLNGSGKFKYVKSEIEGLKGDIVPIELKGILDDVFSSDTEAIIEFLFRIIDELKLDI